MCHAQGPQRSNADEARSNPRPLGLESKFEVDTSNRLEGDELTRKILFDILPWVQGRTKCCLVPSRANDIHPQSVELLRTTVKEMKSQVIHYLTIDLGLGSRSHKILPSTFFIMKHMRQQSLTLLRPMV